MTNRFTDEGFKDYIIKLAHENAYQRDKYYLLKEKIFNAASAGAITLCLSLSEDEYKYLKDLEFSMDHQGSDKYSVLFY